MILPLLLMLSAGCASVPRFPGSTRPVGKAPLSAIAAAPEATLGASPAPATGGSRASPYAGQLALAATYYLSNGLDGYRDDCSGFACAVYNRAGVPLEGGTKQLWELSQAAGAVHHRKIPRIGDLAFFDDTYDRNKNGRLDDDLTHVAVVVDVDDDGTILLAHGGTSRGRTELLMNLGRPHDRQDEAGRVLNDYLRVRKSGDPAAAKYLSGELWRGFATWDASARASLIASER